MATPLLPADFKESLKSLNEKRVEYLLIDGYAVGYYGYVGATADLDVWIACTEENADKRLEALREFGFDLPDSARETFLKADSVARMGVPPFRIELLASISGVSFDGYAERVIDTIDGVRVPIISLPHLKINKKASARLKDPGRSGALAVSDLRFLFRKAQSCQRSR
jgi:predicted nucleotidyltransferase